MERRIAIQLIRPACGAWMPYAKDHCARKPGHTTPDHRTAATLDNLRIARRKARAA